MKMVYVQVRDPISWKRSDAQYHEEDKPYMVLCNVRSGGILIHEDEERLIFGDIDTAADNPKLDEFGVVFPIYRNVMIIAKNSIIERQDFEIKEKKQEPQE